MFAWLKRLFNIGTAEANSALDKLEDPVKMTEQGIKDLKDDLQKSMTALAEVKAAAIRSKKELEQAKANASEYENKAVALLKKAESGALDPAEADRLASKALEKKDQLLDRVNSSKENVAMLDEQVGKMEQNVQRLRSQISSWENELKTLKARSKVSSASKKLNKQLANVDSSGTINQLERMKEKVSEQEALAQSYADLSDQNVSEDDEINRALGGGGSSDASLEQGTQSEALSKLKEKMSSSSSSKSESSESSSSGSADSGSGGSSSEDASGGNASSGGNSELDRLKDQLKDK